jgi:hypothetical protein
MHRLSELPQPMSPKGEQANTPTWGTSVNPNYPMTDDRRNRMTRRQRHELLASGQEERIVGDDG